MNAADEFVTGIGGDFIVGEVDAVLVEGGENGVVALVAAAEQFCKFRAEVGGVVVKAKPDEVQLAARDFGGEFDAGDGGQADLCSFIEEFIKTLGAVVVGQCHHIESGGMACAGESTRRQTPITGGRMGMQVDHLSLLTGDYVSAGAKRFRGGASGHRGCRRG